MANQFFVQPAQFGQGLQQLAGGIERFKAGQAQEQAQQAATQRQQQAATELQAAFDSGDPKAIRDVVLKYPEVQERAKAAFGFTNEQSERIARETYRRALTDPANAAQYMQQGIQQVAEAGGRPVMMTQDLQMLQENPEAAMKAIRGGYAAISEDDEYNAVFGQEQKPTDFARDLTAAGLEPGSPEFREAVLEKYGKGKTIGFDVVEAVNPDTGRREYFQVSRTDPGNRVALDLEVPSDPKVEAAIAAKNREAIDAALSEKATITETMGTLNKILSSPGLSGFSGLDSFRRLIPGTEAANVAAYVDQLQSQNFLTAVEQMKGMGALSENEGKKLAQAVAALSPNMSDEALKAELERIESQLAKALQNLESGALARPAARQTAPAQRGTADQRADQAADANVVNWSDL